MNPWLEKWAPGGAQYEADYRIWVGGNSDATEEDLARRDLCIAAPDMCRALLAVEWIDVSFFATPGCPRCECTRFAGHVDCALDAALTKAGLPDQESRDAARKEMGI